MGGGGRLAGAGRGGRAGGQAQGGRRAGLHLTRSGGRLAVTGGRLAVTGAGASASVCLRVRLGRLVTVTLQSSVCGEIRGQAIGLDM